MYKRQPISCIWFFSSLSTSASYSASLALDTLPHNAQVLQRKADRHGYEAGSHRVDGDVPAGQLLGEALGQADEARLAGGIVGHRCSW